MDFFANQDKARKHTKVLVIYFVIAVLCIIASVYLASLLIFFGVNAKPPPGVPPPELVLWDPKLFLYVVLGTLGVVLIVWDGLRQARAKPAPPAGDSRTGS